jgi:hypothetical protein
MDLASTASSSSPGSFQGRPAMAKSIHRKDPLNNRDTETQRKIKRGIKKGKIFTRELMNS